MIEWTICLVEEVPNKYKIVKIGQIWKKKKNFSLMIFCFSYKFTSNWPLNWDSVFVCQK